MSMQAIEPEVLRPEDAAVVRAQAAAEIDMQISTAKRYPRDVARSVDKAKALATRNREIAKSCEFAKPVTVRGKKEFIRGPSIRLAEIVLSTWGNLRVAAQVVDEGRAYVTCQATVHDLESNVAVRTETRRSIVYSATGDRAGRRFSDDLVTTTTNAAMAIAMRNAVFKAVPRSIVDEVLEAAKAILVKERKEVPLDLRRKRAIEWFEKCGVAEEFVCRLLNKPEAALIDEADLETLQGVRVGLDEGTQSVDELLEEIDAKTKELDPGAYDVGKPDLDGPAAK